MARDDSGSFGSPVGVKAAAIVGIGPFAEWSTPDSFQVGSAHSYGLVFDVDKADRERVAGETEEVLDVRVKSAVSVHAYRAHEGLKKVVIA